MTTRPFREYDAATSRKTTRQIQIDLDMIQAMRQIGTDNRSRKQRLEDVGYKLISAVLYVIMAGCVGMLIAEIIK